MKLRPLRIKWRPISEQPDQAGVYLLWSPKLGARVDGIHPSWWNYRPRGKSPSRGWMAGPRVVKWAYLWPHGYLSRSYNSNA